MRLWGKALAAEMLLFFTSALNPAASKARRPSNSQIGTRSSPTRLKPHSGYNSAMSCTELTDLHLSPTGSSQDAACKRQSIDMIHSDYATPPHLDLRIFGTSNTQ